MDCIFICFKVYLRNKNCFHMLLYINLNQYILVYMESGRKPFVFVTPLLFAVPLLFTFHAFELRYILIPIFQAHLARIMARCVYYVPKFILSLHYFTSTMYSCPSVPLPLVMVTLELTFITGRKPNVLGTL